MSGVVGQRLAGRDRFAKKSGAAKHDIVSLREQLAAEFAGLRRLHELSTQLARQGDLHALLDEFLDAAVEITHADFGNVQLMDAATGTLDIVAQRGFNPEFLDFFNAWHAGMAAAGTALRDGQRVVVEDVPSDPLFNGTPECEVMIKAGVLAVQSTPLVSSAGLMLGVLSTHYRTPRRADEGDLTRLDLLARQASDLIERKEAEQALRESQRHLAAELTASEMLQAVSMELIRENDLEALYAHIVDAAARIMGSEFASMQSYDAEHDELVLLASRGLNAEAKAAWARLGPAAYTAGAQALKTGERCLVHDIEECDWMSGTTERATYRDTGIRSIQSTPLRSRAGRIIGMISTHWGKPYTPSERELRLFDVLARQAADLIERKRADDSLREADRRKDEFLATLAHELRNPLAPIRNSVELLRLDGADTTARDIIERQVRQLARLVDDLLDVSRITLGKIRLQRERLTLERVVTDAVESSRATIEASSHQFTVTLPPEPVVLDGDAVRLAQVLSNLLTNAAKYTEKGGHLWLTADVSRSEGRAPEAVIAVGDTGIGISPEQLPHIFEMFAQTTPALERSHGGLGIGLALVRGLVELHGGRVEAHSAGAGMGSEFLVRLPIVEDAAAAETLEPGVQDETAPVPRKCRVLVVDDNKDAAKSLSILLELRGHETAVAHDGLEAVQATATFRPDVVLLDIGLPKLDGYGAARHIRQRPWGKTMPLVALTGWGQDEDKRRAMEAGFDHHLTKPVDPADLEKLLASILPQV
jgi:signal transduction histidine kinase/ActR/RegA family two-component response regulator